MTEYTDHERQTLRTAAFGAVYLVSRADPGFFNAVKESLAGAKVLATTSQELRDLLRSGGVPRIPTGSPTEVESSVLTALHRSAAILQAKNPTELDGFRTAIVSACDQVASVAGGGANEAEKAMVTRVKTALGAA
jgi:hypothetical protein